MKTNDFNPLITSSRLAENLEKQFGSRVNLTSYNREQLEDIRNKLRTRIFQQEGSAGINDLLTNETYQKDKAMLELLNTRIKEMLGEQMQKLRDKMDALNEGKKGVKVAKHPQGSKMAKKDYDGDGKVETGKDEVLGSRAKAAAKAGHPFKESAKPDFLDMDQDGNKKEPMKKAVKDKKVAEDNAFTAHKRPADAPELKTGQSKKTSSGGTATKTATGTVHKAGAKGYGNKWDGKTQDEPAKASKASKTSAEKKAAKANDIKLPPHKGNVTRHSSNHGADKDDGTGDIAEAKTHSKDCNCKECTGMYERDMGKHNNKTTGFKALAKSAGGGEKGKKIAGAQFQKMKKAGQLESQFKHNVRFVNESIGYFLAEDEEAKAKAITAAGDMVNDFTSWMQRVGQYQTKSMIELADAIKADFGPAEAEAFKQAVAPALSATLEVLTQQRETISAAVAALAGGAAPEEPMGMEPEMPMEPGMDAAAPDEMNPEMDADEFGAADAAAGGAETSGRAMRESKFARRLAESHSIMSKLSK